MKNSSILRNQQKLIHAFHKAYDWYRPHISDRYGFEVSEQFLEEAAIEYKLLIPQIPYIGGSKVHMTSDLMESVQVLALLRTLTSHHKSMEECKQIIYGGLRTRLAQYPKLMIKLAGMRAFSKPFLRFLERQAAQSQLRKYPDGFVFEIVKGDGRDFDWGLNFSKCGICQFYASQNAMEYLPMVCSIDYVLSEGLNYGLVRTKTLAEGHEMCNPRLKRNRKTEWRDTGAA